MEQTEASHWSLADVQQPIAGFCQLEHAECFTAIVLLCSSVRCVFPELVGLFVAVTVVRNVFCTYFFIFVPAVELAYPPVEYSFSSSSNNYVSTSTFYQLK